MVATKSQRQVPRTAWVQLADGGLLHPHPKYAVSSCWVRWQSCANGTAVSAGIQFTAPVRSCRHCTPMSCGHNRNSVILPCFYYVTLPTVVSYSVFTKHSCPAILLQLDLKMKSNETDACWSHCVLSVPPVRCRHGAYSPSQHGSAQNPVISLSRHVHQ
jgi:hypothetical protein